MDGKAIFDFSINEVPKQIKDITQNIKVKLKDINYFIFHQANKFLVDTIVDKLNISSKKKHCFHSKKIWKHELSFYPNNNAH